MEKKTLIVGLCMHISFGYTVHCVYFGCFQLREWSHHSCQQQNGGMHDAINNKKTASHFHTRCHSNLIVMGILNTRRKPTQCSGEER